MTRTRTNSQSERRGSKQRATPAGLIRSDRTAFLAQEVADRSGKALDVRDCTLLVRYVLLDGRTISRQGVVRTDSANNFIRRILSQ
jgi:hypothetical protein